MDFGRLQVEFGIRNGNDEYRIIYLRGLLSMVFLPNINNIQYPMGRKWLTLAVTSARCRLPSIQEYSSTQFFTPLHNSTICSFHPLFQSMYFFPLCIPIMHLSFLLLHNDCTFLLSFFPLLGIFLEKSSLRLN